MTGELFWMGGGERDWFYTLFERTCGFDHRVRGHVRLEDGKWMWRTDKGGGAEASRMEAMDAAEDSLDPKRDLHNGR